MIKSITFLNIDWFWPVFICGMGLMLIFIWKEWTPEGKQRFPMKIILMLVAIISLACIALKPAIPKKTKGESTIIITENYKQKHVDSLKKIYKKIKIIDYTENGVLPRINNSEQVFILGSGVQTFDLPVFENLSVSYLPGHPLSGITQLRFSKQIMVGDVLEVKGEVQNPEESNVLILENSLGTALDSVVFPSIEDMRFRLSSQLRTEGNYLYYLTEKNSFGKSINRKTLPIRVKQRQKLDIMMLNSFPTFEIKYLKNNLATDGHRVAVRNRITKGKFKFEFLNRKKTNLMQLSASTLNDFDLLIADATSIKNLTRTEINLLQDAIQKEGLGLLLLDEISQLSSLEDFSLFDFQQASATVEELDEIAGVLINKQPYEFKTELGLETIHTSNSTVISAYKRLEQGRVGTTVLENTWQLQLQGKKEVYQKIWAKILRSLSKRQPVDNSWETESSYAFVNEPYTIKLRSTLEHPKLKDENKGIIALQQDFNQPDLWSGTFYPRQIGWQSFAVESDTTSTFDLYMLSPQDWLTLRAYQSSKANQRYFKIQNSNDRSTQYSITAINPLWFFVLFLISIGSLWLEPKL